ncbi:phosphate ABC transporter substrate-binding protein PstS [Propionivibrio sp.]|uniref:phosphate ABC transporter substrate-binding protein PstS n=1 Tax=Propionivibrio sp. TaxID=2212460 RepID=UPI0025F9D20E|nr:phosphate ABC transporter substrate-binding protein PstS [Propionivibrio sp.]MBK8745409.1 phosphate ABC transporter substrate-binding protein PstS [Propionivibrio sp.]
MHTIQFSMQHFSTRCAVVLSVALLLASPSLFAETAPQINGTGGSSTARVFAQWNFLFTKESGIKVDFAAANSGVGIREAIAHRIDFAPTEIPLSTEELAKNELVQFPLLIGGVAVIVNIPGVPPGALSLSSILLANIFLGEIKFWNDEAIRAANPNLNLPKLPIKLVVRETPASTTLGLTSFLAKTDPTWASRIGAKDLPLWPAPTIKTATVKVMGETVKSTPGAIGYLNYDEAFRNNLAYVKLRNRAGHYLKPSQESILAAASAAGLGRTGDKIPDLINVDGQGSWPIVEVTYILVDRNPKNVERARSTLKFFFWAFMQGDAMALDTGFVPLPPGVQARNIGIFRDVHGPDNSPLDYLR